MQFLTLPLFRGGALVLLAAQKYIINLDFVACMELIIIYTRVMPFLWRKSLQMCKDLYVRHKMRLWLYAFATLFFASTSVPMRLCYDSCVSWLYENEWKTCTTCEKQRIVIGSQTKKHETPFDNKNIVLIFHTHIHKHKYNTNCRRIFAIRTIDYRKNSKNKLKLHSRPNKKRNENENNCT